MLTAEPNALQGNTVFQVCNLDCLRATGIVASSGIGMLKVGYFFGEHELHRLRLVAKFTCKPNIVGSLAVGYLSKDSISVVRHDCESSPE